MILTNEQLVRSEDIYKALSEKYSLLDDTSTEFMVLLTRNSLKSQLEELSSDIELYKSLTDGGISLKTSLNISELRTQLILNRISAHISQHELADRLGCSYKKVLANESSKYEGLSLSYLIKVSHLLGCDIEKVYDSEGKAIYIANDTDSVNLEDFPIKEMIKKGWIRASHAIDDLKGLLFGSGTLLDAVYHRKSSFNGKEAKSLSLLAWQSKVRTDGINIIREHNIDGFNFDSSWIPELVSLSSKENSPILAREFLLSKGIVLVVEPHLKGTYLDGAALSSPEGIPIIGMTLRMNRIDNFWFVLMHELGHVFKHLNSDPSRSFVDENVGNTDDDVQEHEADKFAKESLIPDLQWNRCVSRIKPSVKAVLIDAKRLRINPAIIAGRLQWESNDYKLLSELTKGNDVRHFFER
ncbi:XRE family transcriptional regulator [Photobacterium leiognathi]|uniref:XRE family transcriptional regulator n=1 Tax=Photobacterium leiognathi TaxID=553611 RepID=UPI0029827D1E|nr:XRE family transcriptional regulator [Photobacterium leiognathi]